MASSSNEILPSVDFTNFIASLPEGLQYYIFQKVIEHKSFRENDDLATQMWSLMAMQEFAPSTISHCQRPFVPHPNPDQMHTLVFRLQTIFYPVVDEYTTWGHYVFREITPQAYYIFWYWLNLYPVAMFLDPNLVHTSRRYGKGKWVDKMLAPIFRDPLTLELITGYKIQQPTIVIIKLTDIWGRYAEPLVKPVDHHHMCESFCPMWNECLTARKALAEEYGVPPAYITHSPLSPDIASTPELFYKERIRDSLLHPSSPEFLQQEYNDYLLRNGQSSNLWAEWPQPLPSDDSASTSSSSTSVLPDQSPEGSSNETTSLADTISLD